MVDWNDFQFNISEGEQLRDQGIGLASESRAVQLEVARGVALNIARLSHDKTCTADQVQRVCIERGIKLGNAAGAIFKGKEWKWSGKVVTSARTSNHARILRVWELVS